jgi:hypothetical protein
MNFDDPKPAPDKRVQQLIYLRPSLKDRIDAVRGRVSRSEWIERACVVWLRENAPTPEKTPRSKAAESPEAEVR